jgi:hypothetical protein
MKRIFLVFFLVVLVTASSYSQFARGQMKQDFFEAEMYVLYEEYQEALPLYQALLKSDPRNSNYNYRIGQCLLNITGRKREAISYLEAAIKDINPKYREGKFRETKAPYDSYYYLANAYRINNQLDKALSTYELFKKNLDIKVYDTTIVNEQIKSCLNARELMKVPMYIRKQNLGEVINDQYPDVNPVVSADQNVIVYNKITPFQDALLYSRKVNGKWIAPRNIIPDLGLGLESGNYATSLSDNGDELYIYRRGADFDGNIFVTRRLPDDLWSNLKKLNDNINTKYWESHATLSHDGKRLYFTSNRKDSYGGLDIYVSERDSADNWEPAKNLGPVINTPYNEESPFLGKDDKTLFFSSRGHFNIGGYDIFYSTLQDNGQWSVPLNLGYPLNTTDDDMFFDPVEDGYKAYYAMIDSTGYGNTDIFMIEIFSKDHPRKFFVMGIVQIKDLISVFGDSIKVSAMNVENPDAKVVVYADPKTGEYTFELPQGKYSLTFESKDAEMVMKSLDLPITHPSDSFVVPETTLPKTDFTADLNVGENKMITVVNGDTVVIPLKVEPNSILIVEHWAGDTLVSTEKFLITDSTFNYKTVPLIGKNRYVFSLTDKFSNTTTSEVYINREKAPAVQQVVKPEYSRVIARKQINTFADLLTKREDAEMKKFIEGLNLENQKFGNVDDIISFIKEEGAKKNIPPGEFDMMALKVAVMENVLSQAAVDLMAANVEGELKQVLEKLNIYDEGLKTWTDLQKYVADKTNGRILPDELNRIAGDILAGVDPRIANIRDKINIYSESYSKGEALKKAVAATDSKDVRKSGTWLKTLYDEAVNQSIPEKDLARMFATLTATPGTGWDKFRNELASFADEKFAAYLRSLDGDKLKIKSPYDLILWLLRNKDKGLFSEESLFNALARMITSKDMPADIIKSQIVAAEKPRLYILWVALGAGLLFIIIILFRKRKKKENK